MRAGISRTKDRLAYTFTSGAETPDELPVVGDPGLKKIINEAIDIVDSIRYKYWTVHQPLPMRVQQFRSKLAVTGSPRRAEPLLEWLIY